MHFTTTAAHRAAALRRFWLASSALTALLLPLAPAPVIAQQTASPNLSLPEVVVSRPARPRRPTPPARTQPTTRTTTPAPSAPTPVATPTAAPAANDQVVVSPTAIVTPERNIGSSVTVITAADIEREQRRTVPDALSTVPGINIVQSGGPGGLTSVFMRGTNSNHVKVLIDGIDASDPSNSNRSFDFGQMLTADLERIEVLRGPQSGLYGADALGGVISFITKKGEGPAKATSLVEGGSFGTFNQIARLSGSDRQINYSFNAAHFRTASTPVTPLELLPPGRQRINDFYDNWTYSTKLGVDLTDNLAVNYVGRLTDAKLRFTGEDFSLFPSVPAAAQSVQAAHQFFQRAEAVWSLFDGRFTNYFGVNYSDHWNWNKAPDPGVPNVNKGERTRYDWRGVASVLPGQILITGLQQETERLATADTKAVTVTQSGYVELQSEFAQRFFLVSNVRYDENDAFGPATTYRFAPALLVPVIETKLKGSYGTGFKAPTLSQLYVNLPDFNFFGNPNLKPEESVGYDFGFEQPIANDRFRFGVTRFHNDITNLINTNATFTSYTNVGKAVTSGYEVFASAAVTERLRLRADYTYTKAIDATADLQLLRRPRHKYSVTAFWTPIDQLTLSATWLRVGEWVDGNRNFSIPRLVAPGYSVVNVAANYAVNPYTTVFGRIDNLLNEQYQNPTGFLRPRFGIYGGIRVSNR